MKRFLLGILLIVISFDLMAKEVSVPKAMLFSAVAPGLGEVYCHNYTKGAIFFFTETAIIFSYFRLQNERNWAINSYKQYANSVVGTPINMEDSYYQLIQDYASSEEYNDNIIRDARNYFLIYNNDPEGYNAYLEANLIPDDNSWHWNNDDEWYDYIDLRLKKQDFEIFANFAVAAAILNRIVSVIDSAMEAKKIKRSERSQNDLGKFSISPDWEKKGIKLNYEYRF